MKNITPKQLAVRIAFAVAISIVLIVGLFQFLPVQNTIIKLILVFAVGFASSYYFFLLALEKFIYRKIKLIYKTIHNLKLRKNEKTDVINLDKDILNEVRQDVIEWDKKNKAEIERLKDMEDYRRQFVGNVAHELKTPIFSIQGYLLTLLEGGLEDPQINRKFLEKAEKSVDRMIHLIQDLDEITQIEAGKITMNIKPINIVALAKDAVQQLEHNAKKKNIKLIIDDKEHNKPIWVEGDYDRLMQVFINLIDNSLNYGKSGGTTKIKFYDMDENILVEISDNGIGIEKEHLPHIFERFYRTDKSRARKSGGTGLGLAIVKHIIEAHKQTINVRSTPDVGTTFSFTLKKAQKIS
jgi:two-component system phosphate regulon sensor histidine kinase PhoR